MSKKIYFNKEKCINDEMFAFLKGLFGDSFVNITMEWINDCDGKLCYEENGNIYCKGKETDIISYQVDEDWCDIIEVEDTENVEDDGIKITYIGEKKEDV